MSRADRFLRACRREPVDAIPIWIMRQAGRYMAEYRALRAKHTILEIIKQPELAVEVTMQPLRAFELDAAIIFADILTLPEAMGLDLEFISGTGPVFHNPLRTPEDVARLNPIDPAEALDFTMAAVRQVVQEIDGMCPLIGFTGAPFTLACYSIEGGSSRNFVHTKAWMHNEPESWHRMMTLFADAAGDYLVAQAQAGAQALQIFDSWAGILSPYDYRQFVLPYTQRVIQRTRKTVSVPIIHFGTATAGILPLMRETGADVIGVDWRIDLAEAWAQLGADCAVQGNLDPTILFTNPSVIEQSAARILDSVQGRPGHIFNLGHGVLPQTPVENVKALVDFVHRHTATKT